MAKYLVTEPHQNDFTLTTHLFVEAKSPTHAYQLFLVYSAKALHPDDVFTSATKEWIDESSVKIDEAATSIHDKVLVYKISEE